MDLQAIQPEPGMQYASCTANDGCRLSFQTSLPLLAPATTKTDARYRKCIILMHGFSGSSAYFKRNFAALSSTHWIVAPDMRGHGKSGRTRGGYHVARLAADLKQLMTYLHGSSLQLENLKVVPVGCSIGAAVLWTYVELFGDGDFAGFVFADQAPLQDRSLFGGGWDAEKAHKGCYDEATMLGAQDCWVQRSGEAHRGLVADCLGYRLDPTFRPDVSAEEKATDERFFVGISQLCDQEWLARLLGDHTRYDHREACELIAVPTLVMAGRRTGCFPLEGMEETVKRVNSGGRDLAMMSLFESGHWLFYEEPERFHRELTDFVDGCIR